MLNWSFVGYKLTLGIGMLGLCAMSAEMWQNEVETWPLLAAILFPLPVFLFVNSENPTVAGRLLQALASAWYLAFASVIVVAYCSQKVIPTTWLIYALLAAWGAIPCVFALYLIGATTIRDAIGLSRRDLLPDASDAVVEPIDFDSDFG